MADGTFDTSAPPRELIGAAAIAERVAELGRRISEDYADRDLALVGILKGSFVFLADLARHITVPCTVDFLGLSSYGDATTSSGAVRITSDLTRPIEGRDVLVVEDIIDSGLTMRYLTRNLENRGPRTVRTCVLLHRVGEQREDCQVQIDYKAFDLAGHFVVGYGLDYAGRHRNLPYIGYFPPAD